MNINERLRALERDFKAAAERDIHAPLAVVYPQSIIFDKNEIVYFPQGIKSAATHILGSYDIVQCFIDEHEDIRLKASFMQCCEWAFVRLIEDDSETEMRRINFLKAIVEVEPQCALLLRPEYADVYEFLRTTPPFLYKNY